MRKKPHPSRHVGPVPAYDRPTFSYIIEQVATGRTLSDVCTDPEVNMPERTIRGIIARHPAIYDAFARARAIGVEFKMGEAEAVLRGDGNWSEVEPDIRKEVASHRRWEASRLNRGRYGDNKSVDINQTTTVEAKIIDTSRLSYEQLLIARDTLQGVVIAGEIDNDGEA
jgi:hypothetical protein